MKSTLRFLLKYSIFWYIFFICLKFLLIFYHYELFSQFQLKEIGQVFTSGAILDISFTSYILVFPTLLLALSSFFKGNLTKKIISVYTYMVLPCLAFLAIADLEIFKWWGIRTDKTVFKYLFQVPKEIIATASVVPIPLLLTLFVIITSGFVILYKFLLGGSKLERASRPALQFIFFIFLSACLVIPIRGGLQQIPVNQSSAYFSYHNHLNLAAVNLPWNFANSFFARSSNLAKPYTFKEVEDADSLIRPLFETSNEDSTRKVLKSTAPNVLVVIWESFTYKAVVDSRNLTPEFNKLKDEGVLFNNIYSAGDRSDKGITGVLSGYPALPRFSIMNEPVKAAKIPSLTAVLKEKGYNTSFYYGGEPDFANLKSYLLSSGFDKIVTKESFPAELQTSKWGVHDEHVFNKLNKELSQTKEPFFSTIFTLSSHEPYDVPISKIKGKSNEDKFCNSLYYTDLSLSDFITKAKKSSWWDNTLIVVIADHGHIMPGKNQWATRYPSEYHIPMLWTGGAVKETAVIDKLGSQTDLSATLLAQLGIDHSQFAFSKNILDKSTKEFAYYAFNNGFGFILPQKSFVFDNVGSKYLYSEGDVKEKDINLGKAYLQVTYRDYLEK